MCVLKFGWSENKGLIKKRVFKKAILTTAWRIENDEKSPETTKLLVLNGTGFVAVKRGEGGSTDQGFSSYVLPLRFSAVAKYVDDCLADCQMVDLTEDNYAVIAEKYDMGDAEPR